MLFLIFAISNLKDLLNNENATEEQIKNQTYRIIISGLALLSVLVDDFLGFYNYNVIQNSKNEDSYY